MSGPDGRGSGRSVRSFTTSQTILRYASERFLRDGYAVTSVRRIAHDAGVDPALVLHYFGSKEGLFLATIRIDNFWDDVLAGPVQTLGPRLVDFVLTRASDEVLSMHTALVRASDSEAVRARLDEIVERSFVVGLQDRLPGPEADLRARLIAVQVGGLLQWLSVSGRGVRDHRRSAIVAVYGDAIQAAAGI